ncbi:MAG TPA: hypothetical protein VFQ53_08415 [Kofleriaceae bacterium]|nr:hypothetical protein [Kofleriaceae bacterium]
MSSDDARPTTQLSPVELSALVRDVQRVTESLEVEVIVERETAVAPAVRPPQPEPVVEAIAAPRRGRAWLVVGFVVCVALGAFGAWLATRV